MIPAFVAIGVVIAGLAITTTYVVLEVQKRKKNSEDTDFRCPECGASVDGTTEICPECMAEFKEGEFECPVCGSAVTADAKMCMVCSERFEEEETFECPHCGSPIPPDTIVCQKCNEEFWSPVRPPTIAEVEAISGSEESEESPSEVAPS
jgi:DNA-directed RNA polymerase subunit RPC12/RpoP